MPGLYFGGDAVYLSAARAFGAAPFLAPTKSIRLSSASQWRDAERGRRQGEGSVFRNKAKKAWR
jgi:hypothetical protein